MQIPGFGIRYRAMTVIAAIGLISRFETPKHLISYAGLVPCVAQSGTKRQPYKHYSKERIAFNHLYWSWQLDEDQQHRMTSPQFAYTT